MKILFSLLLSTFCFYLSPCFAQQYVLDPTYMESVVANGAVRSSAEEAHNNYLGKINNNLNTININVGSVVTAQTIIYNGLANVNSALKDGIAVKNMTVTLSDMLLYLNQCLTLAKSEPYLLLFAQNIEQQLQARAVALVSNVSGFVLKSGNNVLADYNARDQLLRKVTQQLEIMDGLAYGAWRAMFWAQQRGLIASINPYQSFINKDKLFVSQIIDNARYLKANP